MIRIQPWGTPHGLALCGSAYALGPANGDGSRLAGLNGISRANARGIRDDLADSCRWVAVILLIQQ